MKTQNSNFEKGVRTTTRQTSDGHNVYLITAPECLSDPRGEFGPYVLVMVDEKEYSEFRIADRNDGFELRTEFRDLFQRGKDLSIDRVVEQLEDRYLFIK